MDQSGINDTLTLLQRLIRAGKKAVNIDYEEVLQSARTAIIELKEENINLKETISRLKIALNRHDDFIADKGVMWLKKEKVQNQPYCPICYAKELNIMLQPINGWSNIKNSKWHCYNKQCGQTFNPFNYTEPDYSTSDSGIASMFPDGLNTRY